MRFRCYLVHTTDDMYNRIVLEEKMRPCFTSSQFLVVGEPGVGQTAAVGKTLYKTSLTLLPRPTTLEALAEWTTRLPTAFS